MKKKYFALALLIIPLIGYLYHILEIKAYLNFRVLCESYWNLLLGFSSGIGLIMTLYAISQERIERRILEANDLIDSKEVESATKKLRRNLKRIYKRFIKEENESKTK